MLLTRQYLAPTELAHFLGPIVYKHFVPTGLRTFSTGRFDSTGQEQHTNGTLRRALRTIQVSGVYCAKTFSPKAAAHQSVSFVRQTRQSEHGIIVALRHCAL